MRALILCAGEGTRLKPLTEHLAKPAVPLLNIPMWCYPLGLIESLEISELHVNLHHLPHSLMDSFNKHAQASYPIFFHKEKELLGSAAPLLHLSPQKTSPIVLANGDGLVLSKEPKVLKSMLNKHLETQALATVLGMPKKGAGSEFSALWIDRKSELVGIGTDAPHSEAFPLHYASIMILSPKIFEFVREDSRNIFKDVLLPAQKNGEKVGVFQSTDLLFFETGNPSGLIQAHQELTAILRQNLTQWNLLDVFDRFQPGWRNYQKHFIYRNRPYPTLTFSNEENHLVLLSKDTKDPGDLHKISVRGPSSFYQMSDPYPESADGIYWGHLRKGLKNSGEFFSF